MPAGWWNFPWPALPAIRQGPRRGRLKERKQAWGKTLQRGAADRLGERY
jgi:hypothetical protein